MCINNLIISYHRSFERLRVPTSSKRKKRKKKIVSDTIKIEYLSVINSILAWLTTELLYLESVINHHDQTVHYKLQHELRMPWRSIPCRQYVQLVEDNVYMHMLAKKSYSKHAGGKNRFIVFFGFLGFWGPKSEKCPNYPAVNFYTALIYFEEKWTPNLMHTPPRLRHTRFLFDKYLNLEWS